MIYLDWKDYPKSEWHWPNFSPQELACRGTGNLMIHAPSMDRLQALRTMLGKPLIVTSGYRSPAHNRAVGGAKNSQHMLARAFDIRMDNHNPAEFIAAARAAGFTGIGTYPRQGFVHIDTGPARQWGQLFPARAATPAFAVEPPPEPDTVTRDAEALGAVAGAGGSVAAATGVLSAIGDLSPVAQALAIGGLVVALAALAYIFRRRLARLAR